MSHAKSTKITIHEDQPTAISSAAFGANLDALGFNVNLIARKNPKLGVKLIDDYSDAHGIKESDPDAPSEDFELFNEALKKFISSEE